MLFELRKSRRLFQEAPLQFSFKELDLLKSYEKLPEYSRRLIAELMKHMK